MCGAAPRARSSVFPADAADAADQLGLLGRRELGLRVERGVHATVRQHDRGSSRRRASARRNVTCGPSPARASGVIARASLKMWRRRWAGVSTNLSCTMEARAAVVVERVHARGQRLPGGAPRSWRCAPRRRGLARLPECRFAAWLCRCCSLFRCSSLSGKTQRALERCGSSEHAGRRKRDREAP